MSESLSAPDRRYLFGPIVVADPSWGETLPKWLRLAVQAARLSQVLAREKELASEEEVVAYLYTASLRAPLDHDLATIYLVLSARVMARWGQLESPAEFWTRIGHEKPEMSLYQERLLRQLRGDIRRSVEKHSRR